MSMTSMQRSYWNALSDMYHKITTIDAADFHYGPQIAGESALRLLPPLEEGWSALELGCGGAQNSIWLAKRGLRCTAVDISSAQLRHARANARNHEVSIEFVKSPLESYHKKVTGEFDFVHSSHALEFVDDPAAILREAARSLKPGGTLMISTVHPLYNGDWVEGDYEDSTGAATSGVFLSNYFEPPDDVRDDIFGSAISRAYPVSAWFSWLRAAGLDVVELAEPPGVPASENPPYTSEAWAEGLEEVQAVPSTVIFVARKPRER